MRKTVLIILLLLSISTYGQDIIARSAPVDRKMKVIDTTFFHKPVTDTEKPEETNKIEIPIIIDNKEGWEWIQNEKHFFHDDSYPIKLSYHTFKSHPQYKVIFDPIDYINERMNIYAVYNNNGVLVRVGMIIDYSDFDDIYVIEEVRKVLLRHVYIKDYRNNKYIFKKENTKAQNYVKKELNLIPDYVTIHNFFQTYSKTAIRYLEQLKKDHEYDFINLLKCERINNLSFKVTFGNSKGEPTKTYKIAYTSKGSYKYGITVTDLPLEQIDWSQYKSPIPFENEDDEIEKMQRLRIQEGIHFHKVKNGETLQSIARKRHIRIEELCKLNKIGKNIHLRPGQILKYNSGSSLYNPSSSDNTNVELDTTMIQEGKSDSDLNSEESISSKTETTDTTKIYNVYEIDEPPRFPNNVADDKIVDDDKVYDVVDEMPQFPGGQAAFIKYLSNSVKYPTVAEENGIQGRVICAFIVEPDGSISDVKVVKSVDPSLDKEAKRVISFMPKWIPGRQKGTAVRVKYTTPVAFTLQ